MQNTVAIFGGGVAGLSAAHELAERGFQVRVYERKPVLGGKARSIPVPDSGRDGRPPLPGEHGFRFFPGFYKHVIDTMRRTPYGANGNVFDNLRIATRMLLARAGQAELTWVARTPRTLDDLRAFLIELFTPLGVPLLEMTFFVNRLLTVAAKLRGATAGGIRKHRVVGFHRGAADVESVPGIPGPGGHAFPGGHAGRGEQHSHGRRHATAVAL